ncbi:alpha/beta fold hydrolase [Paramicrobacterium humi]|uniref:alpha/beta fold hydrolase n=1 Tax=Paramicrobacterium humi TaxID=640635 RepID=UPI0015A22108|nr:alpha/beta hydrolase [Microbacterium humi]
MDANDGVAAPALAGTAARTVEVEGGRVRLNVLEAGSGTPLLLLHGAPQNHLEWRELLPRFAATHHVICPDLRGAGWSDAPRRGYDRGRLAADVLDLLDALGIRRTAIIAHDWSALVSFDIAIRHPDRVSALVALSAPDPFVRVDARAMALMRSGWFMPLVPLPVVGERFVSRGRQLVLRPMLASAGGEVPNSEIYRRLLRNPARAHALSLLYRHTIMPSLVGLMTGRRRPTRLEVPTLVLMGGRDPAAALLRMRRTSAEVRELRHEIVPRAGHFLVDEVPDEVFDRAAAFLDVRSTDRRG